jgi:hypothetical protein
VIETSFVFQIVVMARVKSTVQYVGGATGGDSGGKGRESGSSERTEST